MNTLKKISLHNIILAIIFFGLGLLSYQFFYSLDQKELKDNDLSLFWEVWNLMEEKYPFSGPSESEKIYGAIDGLVNSYDDDYSQFLPPEKTEFFSQNVNGEFAGIGAEISLRDGYLMVISPLKNSPAERAGLQPGDIIAEVDSINISGRTLDEAIGEIRGEKGSEVVLTVYRAGELEPFEITIIRDVVNIPVLETETIDDVFVVSVYNFNDNFNSDFEQAMIDFKNSGNKSLLLDLRSNPGGFLLASIDMASYFLPQGAVILRERFDENIEDTLYRSFGYDLLDDIDFEIIVLQNRGSASASEIVAGALADNGVAKIAGEQSFGKGSVQEFIELKNDTSLKVTIAKWLTPNGNKISNIGIEPDYEILPDYDSIEDVQLLETLKLFEK